MNDPASSDDERDPLQMLRRYEEKRGYPRIQTRLDVQVDGPQHERLEARLGNLSAEGLQIRCDAQTASQLAPSEYASFEPGSGPAIAVRLELEVAGERRSFAASGRLCYATRMDDGEVAMGVQFTDVALQAKQALAAYILECLRPKGERQG